MGKQVGKAFAEKMRRLARSGWFPWLLFLASFVSAVLHNLFYAVFKFEEAVFFLLTFVLFISACVVLVARLGKWFMRHLVRG